MHFSKPFLKAIAASADRTDEPLGLFWPMPGNPATWLSFPTFYQWQTFVADYQLRHDAPQVVNEKVERVLKLFLLAWLDYSLIKVAELQALTTLEFVLTERFGDKVRDKNGVIKFDRLLRYLPAKAGLTDDQLPMFKRCGGIIVERLKGNHKPTLAQIRNDLAHGAPFTDNPYAGLLEAVRDLIDYAYRNWPE